MVFSGLKKIKRKDPVSISLMRTSPELMGAIYIYGRIGCGKTATLLSFAEIYHDHPQRRYKIFDLWGGSRNEHLYWALPSNKTLYWKNVKKMFRLDSEGIKQYKVNLLYPLTSNLPSNLPFNPPHVFSKIFTIPFRSLDTIDLSLVLGTLSLRTESLWGEVKYKAKKNISIPKLIKLVEDNGGKNTSLYRNFLIPLARELFIQEDSCQFNIDLKKELFDKETISVLCLDFVKEEYRLFILRYFLNNIAKVLDASGQKRNTLLPMREASDFFRVTDQTIVPERKKIFKAELASYIKMGRRGMHLVLDTQSPCLEENTKIKTIEGKKFKNIRIKDLKDNFKVVSYNFENKKYENALAKKYYIGEKECYKIILEGGERVIVTDNHRFFNKECKEIFVRDLKKGNTILVEDET